MARKRKRGERETCEDGEDPAGKKCKRPQGKPGKPGHENIVKDSLLFQYYRKVLTLREFLLLRLPSSSKVRRKRIASVGCHGQPSKHAAEGDAGDTTLALHLDGTLVGVLKQDEVERFRSTKDLLSYSQLGVASKVMDKSGICEKWFRQSEIVDFAIWQLFVRGTRGTRVQHLLCQGYRKTVVSQCAVRSEDAVSAIPGVVSVYPNTHVTAMKGQPWPQVLALMGKEGEKIMINLILDCGIFIPVESGRGNYHQLSGIPLGDLEVLPPTICGTLDSFTSSRPAPFGGKVALRKPGSIAFLCSRILYARAAFNGRRAVRFGLQHMHALNRYRSLGESLYKSASEQASLGHKNREATIRVMMHIFPREFGLQNVFTSVVDSRETVQLFKDSALREDEIFKVYGTESPKIPKRLRGEAMELVKKLQILHNRCPFKKLLEYYCPATNEPSQKSPMIDYTIPASSVSAFCRATLARLIPKGFWGVGQAQVHNERVFERNVDRFIQLRRFESLSLHEVVQDMKVNEISWPAPQNQIVQNSCQSDTRKRLELFHEFVYYIFDSILIPLIRTNFYATESNVYRYRIIFFRQDVWRSFSETALASLKETMFEEIKAEDAQKILNSRNISFSYVRLLPKEIGVRPVMNLKRRIPKGAVGNFIGSSINSVLAPLFNVLTYEKSLNPDRLGATLFSVGDIYAKLKAFSLRVRTSIKPLYFAKVDVRAAFDTIPQSAVVDLMSTILQASSYRICKHAEIRPGDTKYLGEVGHAQSKPIRKWVSLASSTSSLDPFQWKLEESFAVGKANTVFVESIVNHFRDSNELLSLLAEHVQRNLVKIGKKFYRQSNGIPQGSILSSLLCSYFYADLEDHHLAFLKSGESVLLRLIDDFLLITTEGHHAKRFLQIMHDGLPDYGVSVNPDKTLVNFEVLVNGQKLPRLADSRCFPYCGSFIDMKTLNITKDRERRKDMVIADSLTVEYSKIPGKTFQRKVLSAFKIQAHAMFLDTSFNSLATVFSNIYESFVETALKMWTYVKCLPAQKRPGTKLVTRTITSLVDLAFALIKSKRKNKRNEGYHCVVSKLQVEWLATKAFRTVLGRKQSRYQDVIEWLDWRLSRINPKKSKECERLIGIKNGGS